MTAQKKYVFDLCMDYINEACGESEKDRFYDLHMKRNFKLGTAFFLCLNFSDRDFVRGTTIDPMGVSDYSKVEVCLERLISIL